MTTKRRSCTMRALSWTLSPTWTAPASFRQVKTTESSRSTLRETQPWNTRGILAPSIVCRSVHLMSSCRGLGTEPPKSGMSRQVSASTLLKDTLTLFPFWLCPTESQSRGVKTRKSDFGSMASSRKNFKVTKTSYEVSVKYHNWTLLHRFQMTRWSSFGPWTELTWWISRVTLVSFSLLIA